MVTDNMLTVGVDMIEVDRIERSLQRHGPRFLNRIFTVQAIKKYFCITTLYFIGRISGQAVLSRIPQRSIMVVK